MSELQYSRVVKNGKIESESGNFFPAIPFHIIIDDVTVDIDFVHTDNHEVVYTVSENGKHIISLEHPDYTPDTTVEEVPNHISLSNGKGLSVVAAFLDLGIGKGKHYKAFVDAGHSESYEIKQPFAL
jgi:hypothetical protein